MQTLTSSATGKKTKQANDFVGFCLKINSYIAQEYMIVLLTW